VTNIRAAIGAARFLPHDVMISIDERHPLTHGALQLDLQVDGETITAVRPQVGFMHRSAEKLFESRDYRQIMMLANRHDWLNAFHGELVIALALEEALGLIPPARATWTRMLLAEVNRVSTYALYLSFVSRVPLREMREPLLAFQQTVSGSRIHPMINRIGGLAHGVSADDLTALTQTLQPIRDSLEQVTADLSECDLHNIGVIPAHVIEAFAITGPSSAASGVVKDLRFRSPYLAYGELADFEPTIDSHAGDVMSRYLAQISVLRSSLAMVEVIIERLASMQDDPIHVPLPKVVRVPQSMTFAQVESPLGTSGALIVSAGDKQPWRLKLSTPSFHVMQALPSFLPGQRLANLDQILMSLPLVVGDVDR